MPEVKDNFQKVERLIKSRVIGGMNEANKFMVDSSRDDAPEGSTGRLKAGIQEIQEATLDRPVAIGAAKAPYSAIVNRGTSHTEAQPFWSSSWIRMKNSFRGFFR